MVNTDISRLRWRCRRGMREMDLLLGSFLDQYYAEASMEVQQAFARILDEIDQDILDWVMQRRPSPPEYDDLLVQLRNQFQRIPAAN